MQPFTIPNSSDDLMNNQILCPVPSHGPANTSTQPPLSSSLPTAATSPSTTSAMPVSAVSPPPPAKSPVEMAVAVAAAAAVGGDVKVDGQEAAVAPPPVGKEQPAIPAKITCNPYDANNAALDELKNLDIDTLIDYITFVVDDLNK